MTLTIGGWIVPALLTIIMLVVMFWPSQRMGAYDFSVIFRVLWLVPIAAVWLIYMGLVLWLR